MLRLITVLLLSLSIFQPQLFAGRAAIDLSEHTPGNAAVRSLVLPGWGQFFNGQATKAYITGGAALVTVAASYLLYAQANKTYEDYEKFGIKNGSLYSDYEAQSNQAMVASLLAAGVWIYAVTDAYVVARHSREEKTESESSLQSGAVRVALGGKMIGLTYCKRF